MAEPSKSAKSSQVVVESLNLSSRPTLAELVTAVEGKYGKKIVIEECSPEALGPGVTGAWYDTPVLGIIRHIKGLPLWVRHVILHELSHILLGHKGTMTGGFESAGYFTSVGQRRGVSWMCRSVAGHHSKAEQEAEDLAFSLASVLVQAPSLEKTQAEKVFGF